MLFLPCVPTIPQNLALLLTGMQAELHLLASSTFTILLLGVHTSSRPHSAVPLPVAAMNALLPGVALPWAALHILKRLLPPNHVSANIASQLLSPVSLLDPLPSRSFLESWSVLPLVSMFTQLFISGTNVGLARALLACFDHISHAGGYIDGPWQLRLLYCPNFPRSYLGWCLAASACCNVRFGAWRR